MRIVSGSAVPLYPFVTYDGRNNCSFNRSHGTFKAKLPYIVIVIARDNKKKIKIFLNLLPVIIKNIRQENNNKIPNEGFAMIANPRDIPATARQLSCFNRGSRYFIMKTSVRHENIAA